MNLEELYEYTIESLTAKTSYSYYHYNYNGIATYTAITGIKLSIDMTGTSYRLKRNILNKTKEYKVETQETYVFPKGFCHGV